MLVGDKMKVPVNVHQQWTCTTMYSEKNDFKHIYDYDYSSYDYNGGADVNYPDETNDTTNEHVEISDAYLKKELFLQEISMPGMLITITEQAMSTGLTCSEGQFQGIYKLCHFYSLAVSYRIYKY